MKTHCAVAGAQQYRQPSERTRRDVKVFYLNGGQETRLRPDTGYLLLNRAKARWAVGALALETLEAWSAAASSGFVTLGGLRARSVTVAGCIA